LKLIIIFNLKNRGAAASSVFFLAISTNQVLTRQPHAGQLLEPGHQALGRSRAAASVSSSQLPACGQQPA